MKLLSDQGMWEEVHISSERMVRASRLGCAAERTEENVSQWLEKFKSVLQDVAFHSKIGQHAVYASINGKLMSVKTVLHRGDCVEIGTDENSCPDTDWIDYVLTYKAKRHLRSYLSTVSDIEHQRCPNCHPLPGDEVIGFKADDGKVILHKRNCPSAIRMASQQGDSILAIEFKENEHFLYPVRVQIPGVDRYHLLSDLIECITENLHLSINKLATETIDRIAVCTIDFAVHSASELDSAIKSISAIKGVDEVHRVDIE